MKGDRTMIDMNDIYAITLAILVVGAAVVAALTMTIFKDGDDDGFE